MPNVDASTPFTRQFRETSRLVVLTIRLVWRAHPCLMLSILLLSLLQALLAPLQLAVSKAVLDRVAFDLGFVSAPAPLVILFPLVTWIVLGAAVLMAGQLIQPSAATFQAIMGDRLTGSITEQLIIAANRWRGLARFEDPSFADDLERARRHVAQGGLALMVDGAQAAVTCFTALGFALVLLALHPLIPLLLVLATLPQTARQWVYGHRTSSHLYVQTPNARRLQYSRDVLLTPEPAKDVRLYGLAPFFQAKYDFIFTRTTGELHRVRLQLALLMALASTLAATATGSVYLYLVWQIAQGQYSVGDLVLYGGAATMLQLRLLTLGFILSELPRTLGFLPSLLRVLEAPPDLPLPPQPRPAPRPIRQGIVFEHVAFSYPGNAVPVLQDVCFSIRPGECVALVGHNGAGKTTLVKLLLRLYDPTAGRILLDGIDLREYDLDDLRRQMGVIFQDFVRYELTAGENIGLGQVEARNDCGHLEQAAAKAGALECIQRLPQGLDTQLGREFGGRELSGGEWQKLALARAFVRECQLLVLDEPTAALDVQAEHEVYTRFHELTRGRMTLLISHRFSTVRMADRILYLADGRIQEEGSHADLMACGGTYARLYRLRAAQYLASAQGEQRS